MPCIIITHMFTHMTYNNTNISLMPFKMTKESETALICSANHANHTLTRTYSTCPLKDLLRVHWIAWHVLCPSHSEMLILYLLLYVHMIPGTYCISTLQNLDKLNY